MKAEIICVGTELLMGNILNTNSQYLSTVCAGCGLDLYYHTVVGDNHDRLKEAFEVACRRSDLILVSGGLGPTEDDLTKETAAEVFGADMYEDERTKERIRARFAAINRPITENNWKQAMIPYGAVILDNDNGTAPGIWLEKDGTVMVLLPGPPSELIPMMEDKVIPRLHEMQSAVFVSNMVKITGVGESKAEMMIRDLIDTQTNPTIATYAKTGEVDIRITAKAKTQEEAKELLKPLRQELKERFQENIFTHKEEDTLESCIIDLLKKHDLTVSTAESCTAGMTASRLVNVPGCSEVFKEGFVTYSNKAKRRTLGVSKSTLKKYGAVSKETVREMLTGAVFASDSDCAIAISGIAGPDGGTEEKPVGTCFIGCMIHDKITVKEYHFAGKRSSIRERATIEALDLLRRELLAYYAKKKK